MLKLISHKRGQITLDAILAAMFLLIVSAFIYYNVFNTIDQLKDSEIANRAYAIADVFENYALIAYSKDVSINTTFEPMGTKTYTIYFADKKVVVDSEKTITFIPTNDGVKVEGDVESSGSYVNGIRVDFGDFYVDKELSIYIK
ncbi:hypothetical protein [Methanotorris formicicus]|uniref:Class III signal peptide-containing protein n=1 Tax=Methanotorris formicicus Mc-S-70 TaxID=647171 RepID=H1KYY8_9EURY|nr:hypothetical protein [Methanotorris formicicus]EHP86568.1 hypothetical protein MetfoDRAFT_1008 [Methanotorris formicicus Mc-S-70]